MFYWPLWLMINLHVNDRFCVSSFHQVPALCDACQSYWKCILVDLQCYLIKTPTFHVLENSKSVSVNYSYPIQSGTPEPTHMWRHGDTPYYRLYQQSEKNTLCMVLIRRVGKFVQNPFRLFCLTEGSSFDILPYKRVSFWPQMCLTTGSISAKN